MRGYNAYDVSRGNVPDDWGNHYRDCEWCHNRYHLSEGDCDCDLPERRPECDRMSDAGYDYEGDGLWEKLICRTVHTARRDHKDGSIKAGERYAKYTYRAIGFDDGSERGTCYHRHFKRRFVLVAAGLPNERWAEAYCD
jgi:hypothetical protein